VIGILEQKTRLGLPPTAYSRCLAFGLGSLVPDLLLSGALLAAGAGVAYAQVAGFAAAAMLTWTLNARRFAAGRPDEQRISPWAYGTQCLTISLLALILRSAVLALLTDIWHWPPLAALPIPIALTAIAHVMGGSLVVFANHAPDATPADRWRRLTVAAVAYVVMLRLVFAGLVDLLPEEAYYWSYARHLDIGYLDHPPLIAWLIALSTWLLGQSEFAVRLPAFVSWLLAAYFMFRLTRNLFDKAAASRSALLLAVLPIYFATGLITTPDAPLYAAWAGSLFFLERALLAQRRAAWWGVGICLGLGMLAKYTIALVGVATVAFLLFDRRSRRWLLGPEPYAAALIAILIFSPVLIWNAAHGWASFVFQGPRRLSGDVRFSLHVLVGTALILLTPLGLAAAIGTLLSARREPAATAESRDSARRRLFMLVFTLVPLLVFAVFSLRSLPMLNWTGPVWFAVIPFLAQNMIAQIGENTGRWMRFGRRLATPTIAILLLFYGTSLLYIYAGLPGIGPFSGMPLPVAWEEMGNQVETIAQKVQAETAAEPLIIGMDRYWIASELSFYGGGEDHARLKMGGRHLFGGQSLMWNFWLPRSAAVGRNLVLIGFDDAGLTNPALAKYFAHLGQVCTEEIRKNGRVMGYFHWRVGFNYME